MENSISCFRCVYLIFNMVHEMCSLEISALSWMQERESERLQMRIE